MDVETKKNGSAGDVIRMLKGNKILAAKAAVGGHGVGFYKLEYNNGKYYANNKQISETGMEELINNLDKYIITDFIKPHRQYAQLYGEDAFAVIRVLTIYDSKDGAQFTAASIRFGGKDAGIVTDYHGTIYCGLKLENGETFKPFYREDDDVFIKCEKHPDTGNSLIGNKVPKWEELITLVKRISASIPMTPYLVMDVIPTDDGFSVLEINNHGQVRILEPYYPFLENEYNRKVFEIKDR